MKFPYRGWFNFRGHTGKKRVKQLFSTLWDEAVAVTLAIWIAYIIWRLQ